MCSDQRFRDKVLYQPKGSRNLFPLHFVLLLLMDSFSRCEFVTALDPAGVGDTLEDFHDDFFPTLIGSDDISYFFSSYDLEGLYWALSSIFQRSSRNPHVPSSKMKQLSPILVARGGGDTYTSQYKIKHDLEQVTYLIKELEHSDPKTVAHLQSEVLPVLKQVLNNIPPLHELNRTHGLYAFTKKDYELGIGKVYNKAWYFTNSDDLYPQWRDFSLQHGLLNTELEWDRFQQIWMGEREVQSLENNNLKTLSSSRVLIIDDLLNPQTLDIIRKLLLRNMHWYQTKTPLKFGKYVGAYIDDGLNDPIFLEIAKALHSSMPQIMEGHDLQYMWAYKYDSEWNSGINLHADQAAVNVNLWISMDDSNLDEKSGGLVVFTEKPPDHWNFESYNTNTKMVVEELLIPSNFANITVPHKPNRAVIFDSALFHQTDEYHFKDGYENGRINLTFLYGKMKTGRVKTQYEGNTDQAEAPFVKVPGQEL